MTRCPWAENDSILEDYHDRRWCKPVHDEKELFALLVLESLSVGLSWKLILQRETRIREAADNLDPFICQYYDDEMTDLLMHADGLIHHRKKIESIGVNARAFMRVREEYGSFDSFIWSFTDGKTIDHLVESQEKIPVKDELSERISRELRRYGFIFMGPVITYSYMQSIGLVNDHLVTCPFRNI